jgi:hypothetical protein
MTDQKSSYPLLWYTSGTPIGVGQRDCAMERYLGYHTGSHGTGYRRTAAAVPLATGGAVHRGMQFLGEWILEWQTVNPLRRLVNVPDEVIAWAASEAASEYEHKARTRGLELTKTDLDAATAVEQLILEQRTLIEALVWVYAIVRLPYMLSEYKLLNVEFEETPVLDCTCGLGDWVGASEHHAARGCTGIVVQGRGDFLWQALNAPDIVYEEFKTKATPNYGWEQSFEHSGQLLLNMEAATKRLGREVSSAFVPVLYKGKRDRTNRDDKSTPKIQQSPLVYGWYDPGGLNREPEWQARYKWWDDWGKGHTLPKTYVRTPIWNEAVPLQPINPNGVVYRAGASRVENWVKGFILPIQWSELLKTLGPFPKPRSRVPLAIEGVLAEEHMWRERVDYLRSINAHSAHHPEVIALVPRSWNCTHFDGTPCQFKPVCMQDPGWENIETMGRYEIRTPHHIPEKAAQEALGVVFPEQDEDDDGGADD